MYTSCQDPQGTESNAHSSKCELCVSYTSQPYLRAGRFAKISCSSAVRNWSFGHTLSWARLNCYFNSYALWPATKIGSVPHIISYFAHEEGCWYCTIIISLQPWWPFANCGNFMEKCSNSAATCAYSPDNQEVCVFEPKKYRKLQQWLLLNAQHHKLECKWQLRKVCYSVISLWGAPLPHNCHSKTEFDRQGLLGEQRMVITLVIRAAHIK